MFRRLELLLLCPPSLQLGSIFMLKQKLHKSKCPAQWIFTSTCLSGPQYRNGILGRYPGDPVSDSVQPCSPRVNWLLTFLAYSSVDLALLDLEPHTSGIMQCAFAELLVRPTCAGACSYHLVVHGCVTWHHLSVLQFTSSVADELWFVFSFFLSQTKFLWVSEIYIEFCFICFFCPLRLGFLLCSSG